MRRTGWGRWLRVALVTGGITGCASGDSSPPAGLGGSGSSDGGASTSVATALPGDDDDDDSTTTAADDDDDDDDDGTTTSGDDDDDGTSSGGADGSTGAETTAAGETGTCPPGESGCPCDGGTCDVGLTCLDDICTIPRECPPDPNEDNDAEDEAVQIGEIEDCDRDGGMVSGVLDGPDDADWYRYVGTDEFGCNVDPARTIAAASGLRLCKFAECNNGIDSTEFDCPDETSYALSPGGRPGCCAGESFALPDINCTGTLSDDAAVYIRVDQAEAECIPYTLSYHY